MAGPLLMAAGAAPGPAYAHTPFKRQWMLGQAAVRQAQGQTLTPSQSSHMDKCRAGSDSPRSSFTTHS